MNVMDFFKPKTPEATPAAGTASNNNPQGQPGANNQPGEPKPASIEDTNPNSPAKTGENPLDTYAKLFQNASANSEIQAPSFALDPKVIAEVSSKMNFTQGVNPELLQKATSGDAAAMIQLIQEVGRNSYRAALEHTTKLTDTHLTQRSEFDSKRLEKGVKDHLTSNALSSQDNINLNHPVVKAELNRIAKNFAASPEYQDASPQEIAQAAKKYFQDIQEAMNPSAKTPKQGKQNDEGEVDYLKYLTSSTG